MLDNFVQYLKYDGWLKDDNKLVNLSKSLQKHLESSEVVQTIREDFELIEFTKEKIEKIKKGDEAKEWHKFIDN
jgi:hypothetical protein